MNGEHLSGGVLGKEKKLNSNLGFFEPKNFCGPSICRPHRTCIESVD